MKLVPITKDELALARGLDKISARARYRRWLRESRAQDKREAANRANKIYRHIHKEHITKMNREYYQRNRLKLLAKAKEKRQARLKIAKKKEGV